MSDPEKRIQDNEISAGSAASANESADPASSGSAPSGSSRIRRILAICGIVLLVGLYAAAFIAALTSSPGADRLFTFCLAMTVIVPVFLWILLFMFRKK